MKYELIGILRYGPINSNRYNTGGGKVKDNIVNVDWIRLKAM